jgi:predicted CXXCH cytochrome family protein
VGCHVTGLDAPGGFVVGDHHSPMTDVSCESCHSAGGPHDGEAVDATTTCVGCHNAEHSINFSVAKGLPHIDHYAGNALSDAELRERMLAIANGTAEKPLLAFPEGETVGAAACRDCHRDEHQALRRDVHARAMRHLVGADAEQPSCVRCHATPMASGPPSSELSGYRVDEGVGCESCHGPGSAHVQEPSTDNIVGLGDSCPECVIEAVCTSCHTPEWDPGWSLKERLEAIEH